MKTAEEILKSYTVFKYLAKEPDWFIEDIVRAMNEFAGQNIGCLCSDEEKHGTTTITCCNHCGRPVEEFWVSK
jgi:hypothetical protein